MFVTLGVDGQGEVQDPWLLRRPANDSKMLDKLFSKFLNGVKVYSGLYRGVFKKGLIKGDTTHLPATPSSQI